VRALEDFKENRITALVATEVAARGLDIKELPHVVNYELPNVPEDYVHRIGRTARAGSTGAAVSLVSPDEVPLLRDIEKLLKRAVEFAPTPKFEIKEGTHTPRAESREPGEYQPHQDPRRRSEHRRPRHGGNNDGSRGGQRGNQGGNRGGGRHGGRVEAGRANHDAYLPESGSARSEAPAGADRQRADNPQGARQDSRRGGHHGHQPGQSRGQRSGEPRRGHSAGGSRDHQQRRDGGQRAGGGGQRGFARGARSSGGRGPGGQGSTGGGGFSRMK
jgi:ATP-dependent RNA helicase RhlE